MTGFAQQYRPTTGEHRPPLAWHKLGRDRLLAHHQCYAQPGIPTHHTSLNSRRFNQAQPPRHPRCSPGASTGACDLTQAGRCRTESLATRSGSCGRDRVRDDPVRLFLGGDLVGHLHQSAIALDRRKRMAEPLTCRASSAGFTNHGREKPCDSQSGDRAAQDAVNESSLISGAFTGQPPTSVVSSTGTANC